MSKARQQPKRSVRPKIALGVGVRTTNNNYVVRELLGSGGFGEVYRVAREQDTPTGSPTQQYETKKDEPTEFAMKTEFIDKRKQLDRLKVEMVVFEEIGKVSDPFRRHHFIGMEDKGRTDRFRFIIMTLVSYSIESIRKDMLKSNFSVPTSLVISKQTLQALADLHYVGFIHRDIKPHNFAIGRGGNSKTIYILDFGIARKYLNKEGRIRVPREQVRFLGTVKYASRNCHTGREQSRVDDLETWFYMVIDIFDNKNLAWYSTRERNAVLHLKEKFFELPNTSSFKAVPADYYRLLKYIRGLNYSDEPDYTYMQMIIDQSAERGQFDVNAPLDWEGKVIKKVRKKKAANQELEDDENDNSSRKRKREEKRRKLEKAAKDKKHKKKEDFDDDDTTSTDPFTERKSTRSGTRKDSKKKKEKTEG